jgi:signal transduction histidine kinase/ligand-binding sensor domain-containing protein
LVFAILLLVALAGGSGQTAAYGGDGSSLPFDVSQVEQGLEENPITAIVQTRDGYLWLGSYTGLMRFDGVRVATFDSASTPGLRNSRVTSLYQDSEGSLWIGHETGELTRYLGGEFHPAGRAPGWPGGAVEAITTDETGDLWLLNDTGILVRMRDGHRIPAFGGGTVSRKVALSREPSGRVWITGNGKVGMLVRGDLVPFPFDDPAGTNFYERVVPAQDGGLWVLSTSGLRKWRQGGWRMDLGLCPCEAGYVTEVIETRSGNLLAGTVRDGLYLLAPGVPPMHLSRTNGLARDWVRALCEDYEGNIWVGTGGGLNALRPRKVRMVNPPDEWQGLPVLSFVVGRAGDIWAGTEGAGLYHNEGNHWKRYTETNGLSNLFVWSVLETKRGDLFVGSWGGGLRVKRKESFEAPGDLSQITAPVLALFEGHRGELWIGTRSGLHCYEDGKLNWFAGQEKLGSPDVRTIAETPDGALWFGMLGGGLGCWKDGTLKQFRKTDGLSSDFVLALYAERDGTLWIGTSDNGLCRLRDGKFATISTPQRMLASIISQIVDDDAGNLWLGSHHGILRVSKADLNRCADGEVSSVRCLSYGKAEGLASQKCSGGFQPGVCKSGDGALWFPTAKGLAVIDPRNFTTNTVPPPVVIEELLVDDKPVKLPATTDQRGVTSDAGEPVTPHPSPVTRLQIPAGKHQFELHYTGLSFAAPDKVRFRYKLDGLGQGWVDAGTRRVAPLGYLPPGPYTFQVIACNNDGFWNTNGASLSFRVLPWVWQTWWFEILAGAAGAIGVAALARWETRRRVHQRFELLERQRALERERARIARDIHDDLGASLTRISLLSQGVRGELADHQAAAADADQIYATARELTRAMDEIVWAVNPQHDTLDSLVAYLGRFAQNFLGAAGIRCRLDVPLHLPAWPLTSEIRHNTFLAFKEALNNVVKHAQASEVRISLELQAGGFSLIVADNGRGFERDGHNGQAFTRGDEARPAGGNGLVNMQKRLEEIGGRCAWDTAPGEGTRVKLAVTVKGLVQA